MCRLPNHSRCQSRVGCSWKVRASFLEISSPMTLHWIDNFKLNSSLAGALEASEQAVGAALEAAGVASGPGADGTVRIFLF